ncbi:hypothetical protein DK261_00985 [Pseudomonas sp. RW409]|nr:hypothetical protein DK261_00985 [Pseudomonas sp. RW409]
MRCAGRDPPLPYPNRRNRRWSGSWPGRWRRFFSWRAGRSCPVDGREDCWCARQKPGSAPGQKSRVGLRRHLRPRESRPAARCLCEACA